MSLTLQEEDRASLVAPSPKSRPKPLRVLMLCQRDDPSTGGAARVAVELTKRLDQFGVEAICLFVYGDPGSLSTSIRAQTKWLNLESSRQALSGMYRLSREIQRLKPDVVYHHDGLTWTHVVSRAFPKVCVIGHAHLDGPQERASFKRRIAHWIHTRTYQRLIAVSESTRQRWENLGYPKENSTVIQNGVDGQFFFPATLDQREAARARLGLPKHAKVMLSIGRLHCAMKGTDDFLRILALKGREWHGLIAGSGEDLDRLEQLAATLSISDRAHFVGLVDPVIDAYHAADILVVTSRYEPFGLMVVEALACGLPAVGFECRGGVGEIFKKTDQKLISGRDLEAMSQAIDNAKKLSTDQRSHILSKYDWAIATARLADKLVQWCKRGVK